MRSEAQNAIFTYSASGINSLASPQLSAYDKTAGLPYANGIRLIHIDSLAATQKDGVVLLVLPNHDSVFVSANRVEYTDEKNYVWAHANFYF